MEIETQDKLRAVVENEAYDFLVNGEPLSVSTDFLDGEAFDTVTLTVEQLNTFEWVGALPSVNVTVNGVALENGKCEFELTEISLNEKILVEMTEGGITHSFVINTLNSNLPPITAEGESQTPGDFFLSFINRRVIVKTDNEGKILYYRNEDAPDKQFGLWDFKAHQIDGKTYYSYHSTFSYPGDAIVFTGHNPGERVIMDENYNVVARIAALPTQKNGGDTTLDGHEFLLLGEDHYIVMSYLQVEVDNIPDVNIYTGAPIDHAEKAILVAPYIQEVDHGEVVFEWLSIEHPELYSMTVTDESAEAADFTNTDPNTYVDYVHLNAIIMDDDNNLVISCRHLNTMLKIDRVNGTGDLIWALSGVADDFGLTDDQKTSGQHYLMNYYAPGFYSAFNNNNKEGLTNLVCYHLDEDKSILDEDDGYEVWTVPGTTQVVPDAPNPPHETYACGSFQILNPYGVVGWGWSLSGDELVTEFNLDDTSDITFQLRAIYDPLASCATYRVVKCLSAAPEFSFTEDSVSWNRVSNSSGYFLDIAREGTEGAMHLSVAGTGCELYNLPNGEYRASVMERDLKVFSAVSTLTVEDNLAPQSFVATADKISDLFFAKTSGTWSSKYSAQHVGSVNDWDGTNEKVSLAGKNQFNDLFTGTTTDISLLFLTDDENGDALFVDDIFSVSPDGLGTSQSRLGQITKIFGGAGDDIVDMTSQRFDYIGTSLFIFGGDGDDVIWANKGDNWLCGDAGNDRIVGASSDDIFTGGPGDDSMHGGGGDDIFTFGGDWGNDTIEQLATGTVTLWFKHGDISNWDAATRTYTDGENSVKVLSDIDVTLNFGDNNGQDVELFNIISGLGAFQESLMTERIFIVPGVLA